MYAILGRLTAVFIVIGFGISIADATAAPPRRKQQRQRAAIRQARASNIHRQEQQKRLETKLNEITSEKGYSGAEREAIKQAILAKFENDLAGGYKGHRKDRDEEEVSGDGTLHVGESPHDESEKGWLERVVNEERNRLWRQIHRWAEAKAKRLSGSFDENTVDEVTSQTLFTVMVKSDIVFRIKPDERKEAYVKQIAYSKFIDIMRRKKRREGILIDDPQDPRTATCPTIIEQVIAGETKSSIEKWFSKKDALLQKVFQMRLEGKSYQEISDQLKKPKETIRLKYKKMRAELSKLLSFRPFVRLPAYV